MGKLIPHSNPLDVRASGGIVLISCYEMGQRPLGLAGPAARLEAEGFSPILIDSAVQPLDEAAIARARLVGISVPMHTAMRLGVRCAERVRAINPDCHIVFYGLYAELNAEYLTRSLADSCLGGEFEDPLVDLARRLAGGPAGSVTGGGAPPRSDGLPSLTSYVKLLRDGVHHNVGYVSATRGCKHVCLHCPITPVYNGRFYAVPRDAVMNDIRGLVASGAGHITFADPDFLNGPGHARRIARALHAEFPDVTFDFTAKVEHLVANQTLVDELKELGCAFVVSAFESLNDRTLENLGKGHTRSDILSVVRFCRDIGLALRPSFVPFTPWDTLDDYLELLALVEDDGLVDHVDPVQFTVRLLVPPGSALLGTPQMLPHLGALDEAMFMYRWTHPDPRMDRLQEELAAYVEAAAEAGEDPAVTFFAIQRLTSDAAGRRVSEPGSISRRFPADRRRPPRLTEPWFC